MMNKTTRLGLPEIIQFWKYLLSKINREQIKKRN